jgi:type IV pilus assembly protein PilV
MNRHLRKQSTQHGVTLLENMIALIILSVGLLGLAGLQAYTLRGGSSSQYRVTAMQQAQDMADRIRANQAGVYDNNGVNAYDGITPTATPSVAKSCRDSLAQCTPPELAQFDAYEWHLRNNESLPGDHNLAGGYVTAAPMQDQNGNNILAYDKQVGNDLVRQRFTITVRWDGDRTGANGLGCDPAVSTDLKCYTLVVDL